MEIQFETDNETKQLRLVVTSVTEFTRIYFYLLTYLQSYIEKYYDSMQSNHNACGIINMMHNTIISDW